MKVYDNCIFNYNMTRMSCSGAQTDGIIDVPEGVEYIDYCYTYLTDNVLILPSTLKTIGSYALSNQRITKICFYDKKFRNKIRIT